MEERLASREGKRDEWYRWRIATEARKRGERRMRPREYSILEEMELIEGDIYILRQEASREKINMFFLHPIERKRVQDYRLTLEIY